MTSARRLSVFFGFLVIGLAQPAWSSVDISNVERAVKPIDFQAHYNKAVADAQLRGSLSESTAHAAEWAHDSASD